MTRDDLGPFLQCLTALAAYFDVRLREEQQEFTFLALMDLPFDEVCRAMNLAVRQCTFMPRAAELRKLVVGVDDTAAEVAWLEYKRVAREVGAYASPTFQDGALAATLLAVFDSWGRACSIDLDDGLWVAKRREFERVYRVYQERGVKGPVALVGLCEQTNRESGYDATLPRGPDLRELANPLRRRLASVTDEQRAAWRANVARALEGHADVPTPGPEPLATIAPRALKKEPPT